MTKPTSGGAQTASDTTDGQATVTILLDGKSESVPLVPAKRCWTVGGAPA